MAFRFLAFLLPPLYQNLPWWHPTTSRIFLLLFFNFLNPSLDIVILYLFIVLDFATAIKWNLFTTKLLWLFRKWGKNRNDNNHRCRLHQHTAFWRFLGIGIKLKRNKKLRNTGQLALNFYANFLFVINILIHTYTHIHDENDQWIIILHFLHE